MSKKTVDYTIEGYMRTRTILLSGEVFCDDGTVEKFNDALRTVCFRENYGGDATPSSEPIFFLLSNCPAAT